MFTRTVVIGACSVCHAFTIDFEVIKKECFYFREYLAGLIFAFMIAFDRNKEDIFSVFIFIEYLTGKYMFLFSTSSVSAL